MINRVERNKTGIRTNVEIICRNDKEMFIEVVDGVDGQSCLRCNGRGIGV